MKTITQIKSNATNTNYFTTSIYNNNNNNNNNSR